MTVLLTCTACDRAVLMLPGVQSYAAPTESLGVDCFDALDPIDWLAFGYRNARSEVYACACSQLTRWGRLDINTLDTKNLDHWDRAPIDAPRPELKSWRESVAARLVPGAWFALDDGIYEIRSAEVWRRHSWSSTDHIEMIPVRPLTDAMILWLARQLAPSRARALPPIYAVLAESWKHGDLDAVSMRGRYHDVASLHAGLREHQGAQTGDVAIVPGLLHADGYLAMRDYR